MLFTRRIISIRDLEIILTHTPEIEQGLGRFLRSRARKTRTDLEVPTDYCGYRTTTLFHDVYT